MTTIGAVRAFLATVRRCLQAERVELLSTRPKNRATLLRLKLTSAAAKGELNFLEAEDYIDGPNPAENGRSGVVWEFVRTVRGSPVYIKLTAKGIGTEEVAVCISFHDPEFPYTKPFERVAVKGDEDEEEQE